MSAALRLSFEELPPTHFVRLTVLGLMRPEELARCVRRFVRRLRRRGHEYFALSEWREGRRHHHALVRAAGDLSSEEVAEMWRESCRGARATSYCRPVRSAAGAARYIVKDIKDGSKKELPPESFHGRLFSCSKAFLTQPLKALIRAVLKDWREQAESRARRDQPGDSAVNQNRPGPKRGDTDGSD